MNFALGSRSRIFFESTRVPRNPDYCHDQRGADKDKSLRCSGKRIVPLEKVYDLIREAEESGSQHIFITVPRSSPTAERGCHRKAALGDRLGRKNKFSACWPFRGGIHLFRLSSVSHPETKPLDWVLKIYGHEFTDRATDIVTELSETRYTREFIREERRIVVVVRWNNPGVLEIRLPRLTDSRKQLKAWLELVWQMIAPALNPNLLCEMGPFEGTRGHDY